MADPKILVVVEDGTLTVTDAGGFDDIIVVDTEESVFDAIGTDLQDQIDTIDEALDLKAPIASPTFTGTVGGVTATHVGLGNVNNTSDANKPVSTAQQTALDLKLDKDFSALAAGTPASSAVFVYRTAGGALEKITLADLMTVINA